MMKLRAALNVFLALVISHFAGAADWAQWRGPNRDGAAPHSPPLIDALPAAGLKPQWLCDNEIPTASGGGWSSPIVAGGAKLCNREHEARAIDLCREPQR